MPQGGAAINECIHGVVIDSSRERVFRGTATGHTFAQNYQGLTGGSRVCPHGDISNDAAIA
jgi:hypothetical protein